MEEIINLHSKKFATLKNPLYIANISKIAETDNTRNCVTTHKGK